MTFTYMTELTAHARPFLSTRLTDFPCKHVMDVSGKKAQALLDASLNLGYSECVWGFGEGVYNRPKENRIQQVSAIRRMVYKQFTRPFRLVIDSAGVPWPDNLHIIIRDILAFGEGATLIDVPFYVIDLTGPVPAAINWMGSLSRDLDEIEGAIACAKKRDSRADDAVRAVGYTIGEFMADNGITKDALRLTEKDWHAYQLASYREGGRAIV